MYQCMFSAKASPVNYICLFASFFICALVFASQEIHGIMFRHCSSNTSDLPKKLSFSRNVNATECPTFVHEPRLLLASNATSWTFIHIPKTGGSTIELALKRFNISVGAKLWMAGVRPYEVFNSQCSLWHTPPIHVVEDSFTIVRDPVQRLESEFKFRGFKDIEGKEYLQSREGFENWTTAMLVAAKKDQTVFDCHFLPQYHFARFASLIVPYRCYEVFIQKLPGYFGLETSFLNIRAKSASIHENWASNIRQELYSLIREFYVVDYAYLSHLF